MMIERIRQLLWRSRGEQRLFTTHRAPFQEPEHAIGELVWWRDRLYRITRWEQKQSVTLGRGGITQAWDVWAWPVSEKEVQAEMERAAEAILAEAATLTEPVLADTGELPETGADTEPRGEDPGVAADDDEGHATPA